MQHIVAFDGAIFPDQCLCGEASRRSAGRVQDALITDAGGESEHNAVEVTEDDIQRDEGIHGHDQHAVVEGHDLALAQVVPLRMLVQLVLRRYRGSVGPNGLVPPPDQSARCGAERHRQGFAANTQCSENSLIEILMQCFS